MDVNRGEQVEATTDVIIIEPFYGGSHKALIDILIKGFQAKHINYSLITLPAKKWHWRARCGAIQLYDKIPEVTTQKVLFTSSVLNLAELLGIRPDLSQLKKVVYFHENQLIYPVQQIKLRDVQYAFNEITTCLTADVVLFNSKFNMNSFLENVPKILKLIPDHRPKNILTNIIKKCNVVYFPILYPELSSKQKSTSVLHIVWPHRWEFDKGPDDFFNVLMKLKKQKIPFKISILGEMFCDVPDVFKKAKEELSEEILHFGYVENKSSYYDILSYSHVVVSTAKHEFFGVSMLEAAYCGCFPLVPNSLVYPEIYPPECLYENIDDLYIKLEKMCAYPETSMKMRENCDINFEQYCHNQKVPILINYLFL